MHPRVHAQSTQNNQISGDEGSADRPVGELLELGVVAVAVDGIVQSEEIPHDIHCLCQGKSFR